MATTLLYPKKTALPFGLPNDLTCNDCRDECYCQPALTTDKATTQIQVQTYTEVEIDNNDWNTGANWDRVDNILTHTPGSTAVASIDVLTTGNAFRLKVTASVSAGSVVYDFGGSANGEFTNLISTTGTYHVFMDCISSSTLTITPSNDFDGALTIEVLYDYGGVNWGINNLISNGDFSLGDTDWNAAGNWVISGGQADHTGSTGFERLSQGDAVNSNIKIDKSYQVKFTATAGYLADGYLVSGSNNELCFGCDISNTDDYVGYAYIDPTTPLADHFIGFEGDNTITIEDVELYDIQGDRYKVVDCEDDTSVDLPETFIDRVTDSLTIICGDWGALASGTGNLVTGGNFDADSIITTGTTTATTANKLVNAGADFNAEGVLIGSIVHNITDDTWTSVQAIDSATQLSLVVDIMTSGEDYEIFIWREVFGFDHSWDIGGNAAQFNGIGNYSALLHEIDSPEAVDYILTYTISGRTSSGVFPSFGGTTGQTREANGTFTEVITWSAANDFLFFTPTDSAFDGAISAVSLVRADGIGQYKICSYKQIGDETQSLLIPYVNATFQQVGSWGTFGGWNISSEKLLFTPGSSAGNSRWSANILTVGREYTLTFDLTVNAGDLNVFAHSSGGVNSTLYANYTTSGKKTLTFTATDVRFAFNCGDNTDDMVIDNVFITLATEEVFEEDKCTPCVCVQEELDCTLLFSWTNDNDAFGVDYCSAPFTQYMRLSAEFQGFDFPDQRTDYVQSTGRNKLVTARVREENELLIWRAPRYVHQAMAVGFAHDTFMINGVEYSKPNSPYSPSPDKNTNLLECLVLVEETVQDFRNSSCEC